MNKVKIISAIVLLSVLGFTTKSQAQRHPDFGKGQLMEELNLTDIQEKQINDLRFENQKQMLDMKNEIAKNRLEIENMMRNNEVDEMTLKELTTKNSDIQSRMKQMQVTHWLNVYKLLDDNQKELWTKTFDKMGHRKMDCRRMDHPGFEKGDNDRPMMRDIPFNRGNMREKSFNRR